MLHIVVSGEGKSDIGYCDNSALNCEIPKFQPRAMMLMIDKLIAQFLEPYLKYEHSVIDYKQVTYVSKQALHNNTNRKNAFLRSKKYGQGTAFYFNNAMTLAKISQEKQKEIGNTIPIISILFRDSDGTNSAINSHYDDKIESMIHGFKASGFDYGIPMMPKPKSEAWLLCAVKDNPYQNCAKIENESGNDNAPNPLKTQLETALKKYAPQSIEDLLKDDNIDINCIDMPSFNRFKQDLEQTIKKVFNHK